MSSLLHLSKAELVRKCKKAKVSTSGSKNDMVNRLKEHAQKNKKNTKTTSSTKSTKRKTIKSTRNNTKVKTYNCISQVFDNCVHEFLSYLEIKTAFYIMMVFPSYPFQISLFCDKIKMQNKPKTNSNKEVIINNENENEKKAQEMIKYIAQKLKEKQKILITDKEREKIGNEIYQKIVSLESLINKLESLINKNTLRDLREQWRKNVAHQTVHEPHFSLQNVECFTMDWSRHSIKQQKKSLCGQCKLFNKGQFRKWSRKLDDKWDQMISKSANEVDYDEDTTWATNVWFSAFSNLEYDNLIKTVMQRMTSDFEELDEDEKYDDKKNENDLDKVLTVKLCENMDNKNPIKSLKGYSLMYSDYCKTIDMERDFYYGDCRIVFSLCLVMNNNWKNVNVFCFSWSHYYDR